MGWTKIKDGCYANDKGDTWTKINDETWAGWRGQTVTNTGNNHWVSSDFDDSDELYPFLLDDESCNNGW